MSEAVNLLPNTAWPLIDLALAQAASGNFHIAYNSLMQASQREPKNKMLLYILHCPAYKHVRRGQKYAAQGYYMLALRDFEAALIQDTNNSKAYQNWEDSLQQFEREL